ncbi:MAG: hypothetical protein N2746_08840 [Deltaproteobacteria bacterium]|nr:hypothetical protein [Deltaproteobacteria bacterium]
MIRVVVYLVFVVGMLGCLPKVYFNQSFSSPERVPISKDGYVALPNGENFDASLILEVERITPRDISVIKIHGTYLIVSEGFKHLWAVFPISGDKAKVKRISFLKDNASFSNPVFEVSSQSRCVIFKFATEDGFKSVFVDKDGDVDERKCDDD